MSVHALAYLLRCDLWRAQFEVFAGPISEEIKAGPAFQLKANNQDANAGPIEITIEIGWELHDVECGDGDLQQQKSMKTPAFVALPKQRYEQDRASDWSNQPRRSGYGGGPRNCAEVEVPSPENVVQDPEAG